MSAEYAATEAKIDAAMQAARASEDNLDAKFAQADADDSKTLSPAELSAVLTSGDANGKCSGYASLISHEH